jgi:hypothetical protein
MARRLFESFLEDPEQYLAAEQYWEALVADVAESMNQANEWRRWIPIDRDSSVERGNPIFDGRSYGLNRGFRIMQREPPSDDVEISAWVASYKPEDVALPLHELFINLALTEESADLARLLLRKWMRAETTVEGMEDFIDETLPPPLEEWEE